MSAEKETLLRFDGTSLQPCEAPEWYSAVMRDADDIGGHYPAIYGRNGILLDHQFGQDLHSINVYNAGVHGHLVEYWDVTRCLATIFIDDVAAYLEFRAKHLFAWVWLIKDMERKADFDFGKDQRKRA
ncbi:hypothetical protein MPLA_320013 [Mesorhizobium sp. ORS 3359]|nr:hypothetical protein MPLA_320013 [Mesorhizobium sp. ORS 3359]